MPCGDSRDLDTYEYLRREVRRATRVACELNLLLKRDGTLYKKIKPRTLRWIKKHEAADAARRKKDEEEKDKAHRRRKIMDKALKKLTPVEKKILGLPDNSPTDDE